MVGHIGTDSATDHLDQLFFKSGIVLLKCNCVHLKTVYLLAFAAGESTAEKGCGAVIFSVMFCIN